MRDNPQIRSESPHPQHICQVLLKNTTQLKTLAFKSTCKEFQFQSTKFSFQFKKRFEGYINLSIVGFLPEYSNKSNSEVKFYSYGEVYSYLLNDPAYYDFYLCL